MRGTDMEAILAVREATARRVTAAGGITTQQEIDELDAHGRGRRRRHGDLHRHARDSGVPEAPSGSRGRPATSRTTNRERCERCKRLAD